LRRYVAKNDRKIEAITARALDAMGRHPWPGNVRELENVIERGVALTSGERIEPAHLPEDLKELTVRTFRRKEGRVPTLDEQEESYIKWVLKEAGGNRTLAAQQLGIDRVSLWRKLKKFGLEEG